LGIAANLDQYLAMTAIEKAGAGLLLRSGTLTRAPLADALGRLVSEPPYEPAARRLRDEFARWNAPATFAEGATA
jgi:UDP:flavonoid glycosyltransferase YjiC (YdhE family)